MRLHTLAALLLLLGAGGCALTPPAPDRPETRSQGEDRRAQAPRPAYNLAGYPPAARDGYIDGCESARASQYAHRDAKRMEGDPQYAMGWNDGYSICGRK